MDRDPAYECLRAAEHAKREVYDAAKAVRDVQTHGLPYKGPEIEWQSGNLGATRPEPHIALDPEYLAENDIDVDEDYIASLLMALAQETGYRECKLDEAIHAL